MISNDSKIIVLFASGSGSNVENIVRYLRKANRDASFYVFCNNPEAGVLLRANNLSIPSYVFDKRALKETGEVLETLQGIQPDLIVLAGFLWLMPTDIIKAYPNKIVNIHPALLPKFGGKGMYGMHVHNAVVHNKETETGITIHYVNEHYDDGKIILQQYCKVDALDTPDSVALKVHQLEYEHFPKVVERLLWA